jgi:DNA-binding transcriptional LysR family regulator
MIENFRLLVFRTVAQHLNFSRAAEELFLTQPAVTLQIRALEEEFGAPLFERGGGRIALSAGGKALLPYAEKIKTLSDEATMAVAKAFGQEAGELTIGSSQTIGFYVLPQFIAAFRLLHPKVRVVTRSGNTDQILSALVAKEINFALIEGPERRKDIRIEPFMTDQLVLVVPASHGWANQDIHIDDLKKEPLLLREFGSGLRRGTEQALAKAGLKIKELNISMEMDSNEGILSAVEAGLGVAFLSRWTVRNQLSLGTLKMARLRGVKLSRHFSMAYPTGPQPTGIVGTFRTFLLSRARKMVRNNLSEISPS